MARFNLLSFIFLLIAFVSFLFSSKSQITGNFLLEGGNPLSFLNLLTIISFVLFLFVFLSGRKLEAILVPTGSHKSDRERARIGAEYYHEHEKERPSVLISGSVDEKYGGRFPTSQPGHIYKYMRKEEVPRDAFLFEPESKNTAENVLYSAKVIRKKGIKVVDVVSNPSHLWRFKSLFKKAKEEGLIDKGVKINYIPTRKNVLFEDVGDALYGIAAHLKHSLGPGKDSLKPKNLPKNIKKSQ
jgi:uncharacterized SAM-binding protein YcdF (DUF218 family)